MVFGRARATHSGFQALMHGTMVARQLRVADSLSPDPSIRPSLHQEPAGAVAIAQHYIRDVVYGANDGLITTFAMVAGVVGGGLSARAMLIIGAANLVADGLSMGVGNYQSIRAHESALAAQNRPEEEASPARHGFATLASFVVAGAVPLIPFALGTTAHGFAFSIGLTFVTLFAVGALRGLVTVEPWWKTGLEMLVLGVAVAVAAYGSGVVVARLVAS
jgi:vacuolar iron transporter family protein